MKIQPELLKIKHLNPVQKLILGLILDTSPAVLNFAGGYDKTCGEIAKELGEKYITIKAEIEELIKLGLITSIKNPPCRLTNVTMRLESLLKGLE